MNFGIFGISGSNIDDMNFIASSETQTVDIKISPTDQIDAI